MPERRHGAGKPGEHHRVQTGDVDPQLQGVGGGQPPQIALGESAFQFPAVLGEVARSIGRDLPGQFGCDVLEAGTRPERGQFGAAARPDERQRAGAFSDQVGHHPGRLRAGGTPHRSAVFTDEVGTQRRLPQRHGPRALR